MDASFIPVSVTPSKTPFGLDQLLRTFKTSLSAESAIAAAPSVGTVDETFPFMFLMPISAPESAESATRIDLVYQGCLAGGETPTLPDQKHDSGTAVQSATSSFGSGGPAVSPVSIQFYSPENTLSYISFGAPGVTAADDPTATPVIISVTLGDAGFTGGSLADIVASFFNSQIVSTIQSTEIVPGQFWSNVARKNTVYVPFLINLPPGTAILTLTSVGTGYAVGDMITITGGSGAAAMTITVVGISNSIRAWTITSNTFTANETGLSASGGSGSGAIFAVTVIP